MSYKLTIYICAKNIVTEGGLGFSAGKTGESEDSPSGNIHQSRQKDISQISKTYLRSRAHIKKLTQ